MRHLRSPACVAVGDSGSRNTRYLIKDSMFREPLSPTATQAGGLGGYRYPPLSRPDTFNYLPPKANKKSFAQIRRKSRKVDGFCGGSRHFSSESFEKALDLADFDSARPKLTAVLRHTPKALCSILEMENFTI